MRKIHLLCLAVILALAFGVRMYRISNPIADWHSWRQADTSAVTRNFAKWGVDVLHPRFDDLSNIPSGSENPQGYRMVEFPIFNLMHYGIYSLFPQFGIDKAGRLTTVLASLVSIVLMYVLVKRYSGTAAGLVTAMLMAILPYAVFYSRVVLPDPTMVMFALGSVVTMILALDSWRQEKTQARGMLWLTGSAICGALALLLKPTAIFILAVMAYPMMMHYHMIWKKKLVISLYAVVLVAPLLWWRQWIQQFPEGIPAYAWLIDGDNLRWRPAWWRWLFFERLTVLILGGFGLVPTVLGLIGKLQNKEEGIYIWWWLLMFAYLSVFATGNVRHDYYQIMLPPIVCATLARGLLWMWKERDLNRWLSIPISVGLTGLMLFIAWYNVRGYYQVNNPAIVEAGKRVDMVLPTDAKVIAPYQGDTAFLYQTNRQGWPLVTRDLEDMKGLGATHYVSVNYDELTKKLETEYEVVDKNQSFIIIDLLRKKTL